MTGLVYDLGTFLWPFVAFAIIWTCLWVKDWLKDRDKRK